MTYPPVLSVSPLEAVLRARRIAQMKCKYILGTGGRNPTAETPFTTKNGQLGSDCIGFVLWCWGLDRYQPIDGVAVEYPFYEGWINTDSLLMDVAGKQIEFTSVYDVNARPGDAVVYPSIWKNGKMVRMGHIGLIVEVKKHREQCNSHSEFMKNLVIIDCAGANTRKITGKAVAERNGSLWDKSDARIVRWKRQAPADEISLPDITPVHDGELEIVMVSPKLGDRVLKYASPMLRGQDVKELQKLLGFTGSALDGWYGVTTEKAVIAFQKRAGLAADGVVGLKTVKELQKI